VTPAQIQGLLDPRAHPHPVAAPHLVETHISWVLLTGDYAYKIKKPIDLGFLDFSTLEKRRHFCAEELRLNRRLCPDAYLDVVPVVAEGSSCRLGGAGEIIDYAVKMRQWPEDMGLDLLLSHGRVTCAQIDTIAERMASFHGSIPVAGKSDAFGTPAAILAPVRQNFEQLHRWAPAAEAARLAWLEAWSEQAFTALAGFFEERRQQGFVRECHGDLHLGNIAWVDDAPLIFDCIEFSPALRWIDVISEAAFLFMDLERRGRADLAWRLLNHYLEATGDYHGLRLLPFYLVYRCMVRAKIAAIRAGQTEGEDKKAALQELAAYLALGERHTAREAPLLLATHGVSGSGKSTVTQWLLERLGAVRLRSDVERKRLHGLTARDRSGSALGEDLYGEEATRQTYARMAQLAEDVLRAGHSVILDATCLKRWQRDLLQQTLCPPGVALTWLDFDLPEAELRRRVEARSRQGDDASEASLQVLEWQLASRDSLSEAEAARAIPVGAEEQQTPERLLARLVPRPV
jgi:hypothetical protein